MGRKTERLNEALDLFLDRIDDDAQAQAEPVSIPDSVFSKLARVWKGEEEKPAQEPEIPKHIGPFRVERLLGQGGFGTVLLAVEDGSGRRVALKLLRGGGAESRERLFREAVLLSELSHPHLVPSFHFGEQDGQAYYAMEYIEGSSLGKILSQLRIEAFHPENRFASALEIPVLSKKGVFEREPYGALVRRVMLQMAQALAYVHGRGVVHRDFKPGNIFIDESGQAKLGDFGLAQSLRNERDGEKLGTYPYMSPEQLRGEEPGPESDVFSFGSTFYEALSLHRAFKGRDSDGLFRAILEQEPEPLRSRDSNIPPALEAIVWKCLRKESKDRYPNGAALLEDLNAFSRGDSVQAISEFSLSQEKTIAPKRANRFFWGTLIVGALGLGAWIVLSSDREKSEPTPIVSPPREAQPDRIVREEKPTAEGPAWLDPVENDPVESPVSSGEKKPLEPSQPVPAPAQQPAQKPQTKEERKAPAPVTKYRIQGYILSTAFGPALVTEWGGDPMDTGKSLETVPQPRTVKFAPSDPRFPTAKVQYLHIEQEGQLRFEPFHLIEARFHSDSSPLVLRPVFNIEPAEKANLADPLDNYWIKVETIFLNSYQPLPLRQYLQTLNAYGTKGYAAQKPF